MNKRRAILRIFTKIVRGKFTDVAVVSDNICAESIADNLREYFDSCSVMRWGNFGVHTISFKDIIHGISSRFRLGIRQIPKIRFDHALFGSYVQAVFVEGPMSINELVTYRTATSEYNKNDQLRKALGLKPTKRLYTFKINH